MSEEGQNSLDAVCTAEKKKDERSLVRDSLYTALKEYCAGKIKYWNDEMNKFIEKMWHDAYLGNFGSKYDRAVFDEVLALKQRQLDPKEHK